MKAVEFIEMQKQDIETHKDKHILSQVVAAMEEVLKGCPNEEIDPRKTAEECYKKMYEKAKKGQKGRCYVFIPEEALGFMQEYLGVKPTDIPLAVESVQKEKRRRTLEEFF